MPSPSKALPIVLASALLLAACGGKRYGPTHIVDAGPFEKGAVKKIAFLGGDTMAPDVQNRIVDALSDRYTRVASAGSVYRRAAVLVRLGAVHVPPPDPRRYRRDAELFGDADPKFAQEVKEKLGVDAFYVVWVVEWTPGPLRASGLAAQAQGETEMVDVKREVVAQIFEAGTGKELWHTHWERPPEHAAVRLVPAAEVEKSAELAVQEATEEVWVAFWIG